jgi:FkbM family methyltransferase
MRKLIFSIFIKAYRSLQGKELGRLPIVRRTVDFLYHHFKPQGNIALIEVGGHKMYIDPLDMAIPRQMMMYGHYEKYETELFKKLVKRGDVVVDIGAHIGHYTLIAADLVGEDGKVFAFEPAPDNYAFLVKNVGVNRYNNVVTVQKAVSNRCGTTKLLLNLRDTGQHAIHNGCEDRNSLVIETVTLDGFFEDKEKRIDIIKMDVEGAEMLVLQGMSELLKRNSDLKIFTEFSATMLRRANSSPEEYLRQLISYGFKLFYINEKNETVEPLDIDKAMQIGADEKWTNLLCLRENVRELKG